MGSGDGWNEFMPSHIFPRKSVPARHSHLLPTTRAALARKHPRWRRRNLQCHQDNSPSPTLKSTLLQPQGDSSTTTTTTTPSAFPLSITTQHQYTNLNSSIPWYTQPLVMDSPRTPSPASSDSPDVPNTMRESCHLEPEVQILAYLSDPFPFPPDVSILDFLPLSDSARLSDFYEQPLRIDHAPSGDITPRPSRPSLNDRQRRITSASNTHGPTASGSSVSSILLRTRLKFSDGSGEVDEDTRLSPLLTALQNRLVLPHDKKGFPVLTTALCIALWRNDTGLLDAVRTADGRFRNTILRVSQACLLQYYDTWVKDVHHLDEIKYRVTVGPSKRKARIQEWPDNGHYLGFVNLYDAPDKQLIISVTVDVRTDTPYVYWSSPA
ncbi:hypothetical protein QBC39DRAFT_162221 [Podospora conica]|nr:hypothetical protein QBC39DRAFT_162221 [Schizothecium conicum]